MKTSNNNLKPIYEIMINVNCLPLQFKHLGNCNNRLKSFLGCCANRRILCNTANGTKY